MSERPPLTMKEQAALLARLVYRCEMRGAGYANTTTLVVSAEDAADLDHLIQRLERMAPFEDRIRSLVTGRR